MYVCGVTVYDYCHVGHARCYMVFDVIRRWLRYRGYQVTTCATSPTSTTRSSAAPRETRGEHRCADRALYPGDARGFRGAGDRAAR